MSELPTLHPSMQVRLVPVTPADVLARSRGPISRNPVAQDVYLATVDGGQQLVAESGGFHCERLFGPLDDPDPQAFAHLPLPIALAHPFLPTTLEALPVLPAAHRPVQERVHDLTIAYAHFYATYTRAARLAELGAPEPIVEMDLAKARAELRSLLDNRFNEAPALLGPERMRLGSLVDGLGATDPAELEVYLFAFGLRLVAVEG